MYAVIPVYLIFCILSIQVNPRLAKWGHYILSNVKYELQGSSGLSFGEKSIHEALLCVLRNNPENNYIVFDHTQGEIADFLTFTETEHELVARLYHVKGHGAVKYNNSVTEVYEVVGQAIKSIKWFMPKSEFIKKMKDRKNKGFFVMKNGLFKELLDLLKSDNKRFIGEVIVVQPGLSPTHSISAGVDIFFDAFFFLLIIRTPCLEQFFWGFVFCIMNIR